MADQITETVTKGWWSRIMNSIMWVFIGFLMFIVSFVVLYYNEWRVDLSKVAKTAIEVDGSSEASQEVDKQLVSMTNTLKSDEKIGDTYIKEWDYISLQRNVEMYAWKENKKSTSKKNVGGSETTTTTYTYEKEWTSRPDNSWNFKEPAGHENPQMSMSINSISVSKAKVWMYDVDMNQVTLPQDYSLSLNNNNVISTGSLKLANDKYLFQGSGTIDSPVVGDIRVSYSYIRNPLDTVTIFWKLDKGGKKVSPYYGDKNAKLYRIFEWTRDTAISTMKTEHTIMTWALRTLGFGLMWFGLMSLFGPISVFLDVLPIFGSISRFWVAAVTFIVSVILSAVTIIVSMIIHNVIALVVVVSLVIIWIIVYLKNKRKKQKNT